MTLKEIRKKKKLSKLDVADHIGVSERAVANYEYGYRIPPTKILLRMIKLYNDPILVLEAIENSVNKIGEKV